jgi:hypothetical protein
VNAFWKFACSKSIAVNLFSEQSFRSYSALSGAIDSASEFSPKGWTHRDYSDLYMLESVTGSMKYFGYLGQHVTSSPKGLLHSFTLSSFTF